MAKTIYSQVDDLTLILLERGTADFYFADGGLGDIIAGLPKDDIVEGFPISLEVTFSGKTIVKTLTCVGFTPIGTDVQASFTDSPESSQQNAVSAYSAFIIPVSGQTFVSSVGIVKDYAESVFGQPSSEVADDETTYYYEHVKVVISSVEEDPFAKFAKNYSDKNAPEVKAPMFDELKKYLIAKLEMSEETAKTAFANCYSVVDLLNAACDAAEQGES